MNSFMSMSFWVLVVLVIVGILAYFFWPKKNNAIDRALEVLSSPSTSSSRSNLHDLMSPKMKDRMNEKPPQEILDAMRAPEQEFRPEFEVPKQ